MNSRLSISRILFLTALALHCEVSCIRADLKSYVQKPDSSFRWQLVGKVEHPQGTIWNLKLTSQKWQNIVWTHQLHVYQPKGVKPGKSMLLWNTGGSANVGNMSFAMDMATAIQNPVAFLYHIPNQPLLGNKKEDALIAETFVRYLQTGDGSWPLLFPMVKSVVRAMDALQAFSKKEWNQPLDSFVLSGASKRGWTTWLTAAVDDRLLAIIPVVIDTLNMKKQMDHQLSSFGKYSLMIHDYTEAGLVPIPDKEEARKLWKMVDPYFYRNQYTLPKLLINGNNDPYWTVDALNLYWEGLPGPKYVTYVPNAGHDLRQHFVDVSQARTRSLNTLAAFTRHQMAGKAMPKITWKHADESTGGKVTLTTDQKPVAARLWVADSATRDFRKARWTSAEISLNRDTIEGTIARPESGFRVFYAELEYTIDGIAYQLSTQVRVLESKK